MALVSGQACAAEHQPTPTTAPPPDVRSILAESGAAMALLDTFRFELTHQRGGTPVAQGLIVKKVVGDVKKPDTLELTWQGTFSGFFVTAEVIALGGKTYMTDPINGRWATIEGDVNPLGFFDPSIGITAIMNDLTSTTLTGREQVGGVDAYRIEGLLPSSSLSSLLGTVAPDLMVDTVTWIGSDDGYLHKVEFRSRVTVEEVDGTARTIKLSHFNEPVSVEAPPLE